MTTAVALKAIETMPPLDAATAGQQIAAILASVQGNANVNRDEVNAIITARFSGLIDTVQDMMNQANKPTRVVVENKQTDMTINVGLQHKSFPDLLRACTARTHDGHHINIWIHGPAGTGKTTAAKNVAKSLGAQFQFNGALSTEYELMGFIDAAGKYHRTAFREVFENGGVYLFDEVDSSLPKAVLAFNAALANGECRFPDGMVNRHHDAIILAGANTTGNGASTDYTARIKQDVAFVDRWVFLEWLIDEALETALATNKDWCEIVQAYRVKLKEREIRGHMITPRATFYGESLLSAGLNLEMVKKMVLRKGLSNEQWSKLCQ